MSIGAPKACYFEQTEWKMDQNFDSRRPYSQRIRRTRELRKKARDWATLSMSNLQTRGCSVAILEYTWTKTCWRDFVVHVWTFDTTQRDALVFNEPSLKTSRRNVYFVYVSASRFLYRSVHFTTLIYIAMSGCVVRRSRWWRRRRTPASIVVHRSPCT